MARRRTITSPFTGGGGSDDDSGGGSDDSGSSGGGSSGGSSGGGGSSSVGSVTRDRGGAGAGGGGEPTVGVGGGGGIDPSDTPAAGTVGDDSDDGGGGSPGGSSPPPTDVGGPSDPVPDPDPGPDPDDTASPPADVGGPATGPDSGGGIDPSETPAAGTVGDGSDGDATTPNEPAQPPESSGENTDPDGPQFGPGPNTDGGLGDDTAGGDSGVVDAVRDRVMGAEADPEVVDRFTTGGLLSERGESAGLLPSEVGGVDISETRARETAGDLSEAGEALDAGAVTNAQALLVAPFTGGAGVGPTARDVDATTDTRGESPVENALEGAAQVPFDAPGGALQAETAAEAGQAVAEGGIGDEGTGDVTETGIATGRNAAARTATQAQQNPGEFAGAVGAGLLLGGAGAASTGTAASGLRAAVRAEVDPRVGTFGTTLETRAGRGVRDFLRDDRGQADLGGLGRRDTGDGGDSGGSPTTGTGGDDGLDPELQEALDNFADSGGTDLPGDPADVRRAENQPETDIDAGDPVQQRRDQARREDRGADTTTGSLGLDERPTRSSVTREDPLPGRARDRDADTVDDALDRQADARQRFDARGDSLGAGAGGLFGVASQDGRGRGDAIGGLLGTPGGVDATGTTPDLDTGGDLFGGTDIFGDTDIGSDIGSDTDIDIDTRIDTDQTPDIDTGDPSLDTDISDPTTRDPPTRDPRGPGSDPGDPPRRDPDVPVEFDDEDETDTDAALFGTLADGDTVDSGIASVRDLLGR